MFKAVLGGLHEVPFDRIDNVSTLTRVICVLDVNDA